MGAGSPRKPQRDSGKPFQASYVHSCTGSPPHLGFFCTQHKKIVKEAYVGNEENRQHEGHIRKQNLTPGEREFRKQKITLKLFCNSQIQLGR